MNRLPLITLAVPFGIGGLAEAWTAASPMLHLPESVGQTLWGLTALLYLVMLLAHVRRGRRVRIPLGTQLRDVAQGPLAALVPTTVLLLSVELHRWAPELARGVVLVALAADAVLGGWIAIRLIRGAIPLTGVHGGYLLPYAAAGLIGGEAAAVSAMPALGWLSWSIGVLGSLVITALVLLRLRRSPDLPAPLVPSIAILAAPPAVAGLALRALDGPDAVAVLLGLLTLVAVAAQLLVLRRYLRLAFSLGFWSFTFTSGALVADAIAWLARLAVPGAAVVTVVLLVMVTALIGSIAARSLALLIPRRPQARVVSTQAGRSTATVSAQEG